MRLTSAIIKGYGRLVDAKINLDSKVIAIVGPNEAGKTTLLKAMRFLNDNQELSPKERARASDVKGNDSIITTSYVLEKDDLKSIDQFDLEEQPKLMTASRKADGGGVYMSFDPAIRKSLNLLRRAHKTLSSYVDRDDLLDFVSTETIYNDPGSDSPHDFRMELKKLIETIDLFIEENDELTLDEEWLGESAQTLKRVLVEGAQADFLGEAFTVISEWVARGDVAGEIRKLLWGERTPRFLLFGEEDRLLNSAYTIDDSLVSSTPSALSNLLKVAGLDLRSTLQAIRDGDIARRETAVKKANKKLENIFKNAWKQGDISVVISVDGMELRVSVLENDDDVTVFDERSAGMRMFVALIAFLAARHEEDIPPILLIDEAENHLHIDAQADLVSMFMKQDRVSKVVYTTHSPACLPPDLGTSIRSVVPIRGTQKSIIRNSFWTEGAGFTPLMIAMGAAAAAFTPARYVVLAEGATEMILLPTLIRNAIENSDEVLYQVAPGLSEVPKDFYKSLDLEAARVAYLVDGDDGGNVLRQKLESYGVPAAKIIQLSVPGIENLLDANIYRDVVKNIMGEQYDVEKLKGMPVLGKAGDKSWAKELEQWSLHEKLRMPSKIAVASRLIEQSGAKASKPYKKAVISIHEKLVIALGIDRVQGK